MFLLSLFTLLLIWKLMATQAEIAAEVNAVKDQLVKVADETRGLLTKIDDLTKAFENAKIADPVLIDAVNALKAQAQVVDDLVPDVTPGA